MRRSIFKCLLCLLCLIFMLLGCGSKENENINDIENSEDGIVHTESSEGESTELTGNLEEAFPVRSEDGMQDIVCDSRRFSEILPAESVCGL